MKFNSQRFLVVYSGVLTAVFAVTVLSGFVKSPGKATFEEIDVQRINLREADGTLRLVINSSGKAPGIIIKGKEYPHPDRKAAGMIFFNDEGTENGGLIFGGEKNADGSKESHGHLSFDAYEQDQTMALSSHQVGNKRASSLVFTDYPDYSILQDIQFMASIKDLPKDQQKARWTGYQQEHGKPATRMVLGRDPDNSVALSMSDEAGHPRIVMKVAPDGTPSLQMLDEHGKVTGELVPKK